MFMFLFDEEWSGGFVFEGVLFPDEFLALLLFCLPLPVNLYIAYFCFSLSAGENSRFLISLLADRTDDESLDFVVLLNLLFPVFLKFWERLFVFAPI